MKVVENNIKKLSGTARADRKREASLGITELPKPNRVLNKRARAIYNKVGKMLIDTGKLQEVDQYVIELFASSLDQFYWATEAMDKMNNVDDGSGYVQTFKSGASNITAEMSVQEKAFDKVLKMSKLLGLSIKDRYAMSAILNDVPNQTELEFQEFRQAL